MTMHDSYASGCTKPFHQRDAFLGLVSLLCVHCFAQHLLLLVQSKCKERTSEHDKISSGQLLALAAPAPPALCLLFVPIVQRSIL